MPDSETDKLATEVVRLFPVVMHSLFSLSADDPAAVLPLGQLRVCSILEDGPRSITSLSKLLDISLSATTQLADRLEHAGLVERACEHSDRRVKCLRLTGRGEQIVAGRRQRRVSRVARALSRLSPDARERVVSSLRELVDACSYTGADAAAMPAERNPHANESREELT